MVGDTLTIDGTEFEVVWNGGALLAPRDSRPGESEPSPRAYNKTGRHVKPKRIIHLTPPEAVVTRDTST